MINLITDKSSIIIYNKLFSHANFLQEFIINLVFYFTFIKIHGHFFLYIYY